MLEYNNYLEEVECIVFSIVNEEPDAEEQKAKLKKYEEENKSQIVIRQSQRADEERSIADRIAAEQRDAERQRRECILREKTIAECKKKYKEESTQVMLGERDQISKELVAAQMQGYKNEIMRQGRGGINMGQIAQGPRVREPDGGLYREKKMDRELYLKRQAAGGGIPSNSSQTHERNWQLTVSSLFCPIPTNNNNHNHNNPIIIQ